MEDAAGETDVEEEYGGYTDKEEEKGDDSGHDDGLEEEEGEELRVWFGRRWPGSGSGVGMVAVDVVMVTSMQTKFIAVPGVPVLVSNKAKFQNSPAFIYFVAALSVVGLYSIITTLASFFLISKPSCSTKAILHLAIWDVLMLGLAASATGTAGGVAYIGLKGNSHVGWNKVCNTYDKFCRHVGGSIAVALFASILLVLLVWLSLFTLYSRIRK